MLKQKLRKNLDLIIFLAFIGIVYAGGWQADVFGFVQRGILALGLFEAEPAPSEKLSRTNLNFQLQDTEGKAIDVKQLEGKTIFVNIWASWCPPCVAEMPGIHQLWQDLKSAEDIVFLMISVDEDREKAIRFMKRKDYGFPLYFPVSGLPREFAYKSIPTTFVIAPEGNIVYQKEGMASYNNQEFRDFLLNL